MGIQGSRTTVEIEFQEVFRRIKIDMAIRDFKFLIFFYRFCYI